MDVALIASNLNQLKHLLTGTAHPFFGICLSAIIISFLSQFWVLIGLSCLYYITEDRETIVKAKYYSMSLIVASGLIIAANLAIATFGE